MRKMMFVALVAILAALAGCSSTATAPKPARPVPAAVLHPSTVLPGVFEPGVPFSYRPVESFASLTGVQPRFVLWYSGLDPFPAAFASSAAAHNALPVVQINPGTASMAAVAAGKYDAWLNSYAASVRAYGRPVVIGFAAEPNGTWDQWGDTHTAPATWIAAWRHVVNVFRRDGADNVAWLWTVNAVNLGGAAVNPSAWWPGSAYVTLVGIDGYYYQPTATWQSVFAPVLKDIRGITSDPVMISETAVGPGPAAPRQIAGLFAGARSAGLVGLVWFDQDQHDPPYHQDWRLEDSAALNAYREAVHDAP